ncbi:hypothetical protein HII36_22560 [Nonomuraea sp. NN258]|uniref:hypothetical protein n=1 Tax=Nonomuraea antri TaxID=2730852 RepID=UPI00156A1D2A|nr:hypothetical protein [Nonomuraea antri]NRQ34598.1 hypothetical protein [Nonomuraea antri]
MSMLAEAVRNNAEWCEAMCRTHGLPSTFTERAWVSPRRTPVLYPDAVTLSPDATARDVLAGIDDTSGASIKDSYARLDLPGYDVLFNAQWIHRPAEPPAGSPPGDLRAATGDEIVWTAVADAAGVAAWQHACFADGPADRTGGPVGLFRPAILDHATLLSGSIGGDVVCGSVLNASGRVVGVSNVFAAGCDLDAAWAGTLAMAHRLFPGRPLVGYESDVDCPLRHGFAPIGPLRVWLRP